MGTQMAFLNKAQQVHGNRYDYSSTQYTRSSEKITLGCRKHGFFDQVAAAHLRGQGCRKCVSDARTLTTETFVERAKKTHGNLYDYSQTVYVRSNEPVTILCRTHGPFVQRPNGHLSGSGCDACADDLVRLGHEVFILRAREVHGDKYDYAKVIYVSSTTKVVITCAHHGDFEQQPAGHLTGYGCRACYDDRQRRTHKTFLEEAKRIHGNTYDYSRAVYNTKRTQIELGCSKHGWFKQTAGTHLSGAGCPKCKSSHGEVRIRRFLEKAGLTFEEQKTFPQLRSYDTKRQLRYDFFVPGANLLIEFDGAQHYHRDIYENLTRGRVRQTFDDLQRRDAYKTMFAASVGIKLLRIPYTDLQRLEEILSTHLSLKTES